MFVSFSSPISYSSHCFFFCAYQFLELIQSRDIFLCSSVCFWLLLVCQTHFLQEDKMTLLVRTCRQDCKYSPHAFLQITKVGVQCGPADTSVFGTERLPPLILSGKTERALLELPVRPGPQGEFTSVGRDRNWLKLSFHPPKCQLDL